MVFRHAEKTTFGHNRCVTPKQINSDRAAALDVFNGENFNAFYSRAWRIVTGSASKADFQKTIPHSCASHLMNNAKRIAKKHYKRFYSLGMHMISLLMNCQTLTEFSSSLYDIAIVLLSNISGATLKQSIERLDERLERIGQHMEAEWNDKYESVEVTDHDNQLSAKSEDDCLSEQISSFTSHFKYIIAKVNDALSKEGDTASLSVQIQRSNKYRSISFFSSDSSDSTTNSSILVWFAPW